MTTPPRAPRFATVLRGYENSEVDNLVERINRSLEMPTAPSAITPDEIEAAQFRIVLRGYDEQEVDHFLDEAIWYLRKATGTAPTADTPAAPLESLATKPRGQRFAIGFGRPYRTADVDAFVERVEATLNTTLTSFEVQSVVFRTGFRGYRVDPVDEWLDQVQAFLLARGR
ncbi:MAG: DivIVA domain-containing protein [Stackebrandtia sp.]